MIYLKNLYQNLHKYDLLFILSNYCLKYSQLFLFYYFFYQFLYHLLLLIYHMHIINDYLYLFIIFLYHIFIRIVLNFELILVII